MRITALLVAMCMSAPACADTVGPVPPSYSGTSGKEWPDGPNKNFFQSLQRPDARFGTAWERSCCGPGDIVKTKFKVEQGTGPHADDVWYAWLNGGWERIPASKIVPDFAPDGQAYLFVSIVGDQANWAAHSYHVVLCFVRPKGGL